jgi:hypothetical protein
MIDCDIHSFNKTHSCTTHKEAALKRSHQRYQELNYDARPSKTVFAGRFGSLFAPTPLNLLVDSRSTTLK